MQLPHPTMFYTQQNVIELRNVRKILHRARLYRLAGYDDRTSDELSQAADRCYRLLKECGLSRVIKGNSDITAFVLDIAQFGHPVSTLHDRIGHFLGDDSRDFVLMSIATLLAQIELDKGSYTTAGDTFSYALLASGRLHGLEHKSTFKLLHGLGQALHGEKKWREAEVAFRSAFEGYMRGNDLTLTDHQDIQRVIRDLRKVREVRREPTPTVRASPVWMVLMSLLILASWTQPWGEWSQVRQRPPAARAALIYVLNDWAIFGRYLLQMLQSSVAHIFCVQCG